LQPGETEIGALKKEKTGANSRTQNELIYKVNHITGYKKSTKSCRKLGFRAEMAVTLYKCVGFSQTRTADQRLRNHHDAPKI
jgi:hypothetical protein